jgi:hypothetical protein
MLSHPRCRCPPALSQQGHHCLSPSAPLARAPPLLLNLLLLLFWILLVLPLQLAFWRLHHLLSLLHPLLQ